jgi:hypothetical protein
MQAVAARRVSVIWQTRKQAYVARRVSGLWQTRMQAVAARRVSVIWQTRKQAVAARRVSVIWQTRLCAHVNFIMQVLKRNQVRQQTMRAIEASGEGELDLNSWNQKPRYKVPDWQPPEYKVWTKPEDLTVEGA